MEPSGHRSPPKAEVDDSPLHQAMDRNKESLKVKLMLRRPINQLVAQGIMPPLKTPPGFHEQRQKLERAKMGDLLRAKIQQRPDREELVRQHILEADVGHVDPSLAEKQRQLKKCRLADALNDQLSHRPGPLELIKKNILHTEEPIERAVKEGAIEFKATCEGASTKPPHPDHYMLDEDSSSLSPPPAVVLPAVGSSEVSSSTTPSTASTPPSTASTPSSAGTVPPALVTVLLAPVTLPSPVYQVGLGLHLDHREVRPQSTTPKPVPQRKKSKVKTTPKARTIKFHEYKGPPNAQKNSTQNPSSVETSYELLLQQQQLFLQWQLEWQHKYPQILLPASQKPATTPTSSASSTSGDVVPPPPPPLPQSPPPLRNLEDMKVSDLKAELKRRNLPVSGAKPQLIERLKPFSEPSHQLLIHHTEDSLPSVCSVSSSGQGGVSSSCSVAMEAETSPPPSPPTSTTMESSSSEDIIREQQRKIDQLERQLTLQLHSNTFQQQQPVQPAMSAKASLAAFLQQHQQQQHQLLSNNNNNNNKEVAPLPGFVGTFIHSSGGPGDLAMEEGNDVKSQIVDDVLEILIKNGELPASAAAEPLSLDLELDSADLMEVDTAWLDSLELSPPPGHPTGHLGQTSLQPPSHRGGDPLIGGTPFDLFMDEDPDLKMAAVDWGSPDRIDFAI